MKCPFCGAADTKVTDSRLFSEGEQIKRRRECVSCQERFTTYELAELSFPRVIKRGDVREEFSEQKLKNGMLHALQKRSVSAESIERSINIIKHELRTSGEKEVKSSFIGELVMRELKKLDEVAYVRFASVYRRFKDIAEFKKEIDKIASLI